MAGQYTSTVIFDEGLEEEIRHQVEVILIEESLRRKEAQRVALLRRTKAEPHQAAEHPSEPTAAIPAELREEEIFFAIEAHLASETASEDAFEPHTATVWPLAEDRASGAAFSPSKKQCRRQGKAKKRLITAACTAGLLCVVYCTAVFSGIPFIDKWRAIYIQTAMETLNHKWLATYFIPKPVIDGVMEEQDAVIAAQQNLQSTWKGSGLQKKPAVGDTMTKAAFFKLFKELDLKSFNTYVKDHPDVLNNGYGRLLIDHAGLKDSGTSIKTVQGDQVLAVDAEHGIIIVKVAGDGYVGKLAIVEDPSAVSVAVSKTLGKSGQSVAQIADANDAVLAINASGFADYQGTGNGGKVVGLLIAEGKKYNSALGGTYKNIGFGKDDRLYVGVSTKDIAYRDAVQFLPALVVNGVDVIAGKTFKQGTTAFGIQPRTAIGQAKDGTVLLLTIDGRKPGYSLGSTVEECAAIMMRYKAVQASNLDGGSSTVMFFNGREITDPADKTDYGRPVPDAIIVKE